MKKYKIVTLGCKVNQYESDGISQGLEKKGFVKGHPGQEADVFIVNTCAVTSKAGMQSRQAIRKLIRDNPQAKIIVTGCHAQTDPEQIQNIDNDVSIVCHKDKTKIADHITEICENRHLMPFKPVNHTVSNFFADFSETVSGSMTRAYLKIQDGCNSFCTYCIVPYARGGSVSMPEDQVLRHLGNLAAKGFKEVILTGIHTGLYGLDLDKSTCLSELLKKANRENLVHRIRLSSIEPKEITDEIIEMAMPGNILCNHFHIPLQSGDDKILKQMKRPYNAGFFSDMVLKINDTIPGVGIGVDTLIGFPSETDQQFENTYNLIKRLPVSYLHVFPFSRRKGTPAYHFKDQVKSQVIKERCRLMRELDFEKRKIFSRKSLGNPVEGLIQHEPDRETGYLKAVTSNYLTVLIDGSQSFKGKILDLVPEQCDSDLNIIGRPL